MRIDKLTKTSLSLALALIVLILSAVWTEQQS